MEIGQIINSEVKEKLQKQKPLPHRKKEVLSEEDIKELMGYHRKTYKKVRGRIRQHD